MVLLLSPCFSLAEQITLSLKDKTDGQSVLFLQNSYASHEINDTTGELSFLTYTMFLFYPLAEKIYLRHENKDVLLQRTMNNWSQEQPVLKSLLEKMLARTSDARVKANVTKALAHPMFQQGRIPKFKDVELSLLPVNDAIRLWIGSQKQFKVHAIHAKALDTYDGHIVTKAMLKQHDKLVLKRK